MKHVITILLFSISFIANSQTYNFSSIKTEDDTVVKKVNTIVQLNKQDKKLYVSVVPITCGTPKRLWTFSIIRYSVADKYQLMDCRDSITSKPSYVEIFQGKKETYMTVEESKIKYILK